MVKYRYGGVYTQGSGYTEKHTYVTQQRRVHTESTHRRNWCTAHAASNVNYQLQLLVRTTITGHLLPVTRPYSKGQNCYWWAIFSLNPAR